MPQDAAKTYQCRHIFADGHRCGARSLRAEHFCYYHHTSRHPAPRTKPENPAQATFDLPLLEDRASIQAAIGEILRRIASNEIDPRRAGLLLYGLQIASLNLPPQPKSDASTRSPSTRAMLPRLSLRNHTPEPRDPEPIEAYETHPTLGPLAPIAEYTDPEEELSFVGQLFKEFGEDPTAQNQQKLNPLPFPPSGRASLAI